MTLWHAIILGIIEGITEFLPVSSTGHLILAGKALGIAPSAFTTSFDIVIQLGAIAAVAAVYWKELWRMAMIKKLIVAFIPTGVIGLLFYKIVKEYLLQSSAVVVAALAIGGLMLIAFEVWQKAREKRNAVSEEAAGPARASDLTYRQAAVVGLFQAAAIVPGVSRSAATIIGGLSLGLPRAVIVEFSFLLAVPTMLAASGLDMLKNYGAFSSEQFGALAAGFIVSFAVAWASIAFLLKFIRRHTFVSFGIYRIILAAVFWYFFILPALR